MEKISLRFDKVITYLLLIVGMVLISVQTLTLIWEMGRGIYKRFNESGLTYDPEHGRTTIVLFFNVLLALEILETVKAFAKSHEVKIRIILIVCLIAVSRKFLMLDLGTSHPVEEAALAALVVAFSLGYFLVTGKFSLDKKIKDNNDTE
jgi:uncharacterized membrane protein (DUF373 family)